MVRDTCRICKFSDLSDVMGIGLKIFDMNEYEVGSVALSIVWHNSVE